MAKHTLLDTVEAARREITRIHPEEVSIVDRPAILHKFSLVKSDDPPAEAPPTTAAVLQDVEKAFGERIAAIEKAIGALGQPAGAESAPPADAPKPATTDDVSVDAVAAAVITKLQDAGVVEAPKAPKDVVAGELTALRDDLTKSFGQIGDVLTAVTERLTAIEGQDSGSQAAPETPPTTADVVPVTPGDVTKAAAREVLTSMVFGGFAQRPTPSVEA